MPVSHAVPSATRRPKMAGSAAKRAPRKRVAKGGRRPSGSTGAPSVRVGKAAKVAKAAKAVAKPPAIAERRASGK